MNAMTAMFNDNPSKDGCVVPSMDGPVVIAMIGKGDSDNVRSVARISQMTESPIMTSTDFPAMSTPVTWRNVKPHWR